MTRSFQPCSTTTSSAWTRSASSRNSSTRRRAVSSRCSTNPETDGIRDPESDNPTDHPSHRMTTPTSDQRRHCGHDRKDNNH